MNKQDVLNAITKEPRYMNYCKRVATGSEHYTDLFQYCFLELQKKDESYLVEKYISGELMPIFAGIAYKSYNSKYSEFQKTYQYYYKYHQNISCTNLNDIEYTVTYKPKLNENIVKKEIEKYRAESKANEYIVDLFNVYVECGTFREVERRTGIYFVTAQKTIQKFKKEIKERCQKYLK